MTVSFQTMFGGQIADEFPIQYVDECLTPCPPPGPEIPAEVHNHREFNAEAAWAATVIACGGER